MIPEVLPTSAQEIAPDTFLVPTLAKDPLSAAYIGANSLVIRGDEPIVVDTGCALVRDHWAQQVLSVVDPQDVRWVYVSHDDHDHIGNLLPVLEMCPNATLVANFVMVSRLFGDVELPFERMHWVDVGDTFTAGDRTLTVVRPPLFDSPSSRGFVDSATGLFWAVDSFGAQFAGAGIERADVPDDLYAESFAVLNTWNTPWLEWIDAARFDAHLRDTEELDVAAVASAHGPVLRGDAIADGYRRTRELVGRAPAGHPGQETLEAILSFLLPARADG
jgi:flavorubredoxin